VDAWKKAVPQGQTVYGAFVRRTAVTAAGEVVGKELAPSVTSFDMSASGTATGYSLSSAEPRKTTVDRLATATNSGYDLDRDGAVVELVGAPTIEADGVHWRVRGRASQFRRPDEAAIRSALAGRPIEDVITVIQDRGLRVVTVATWPGWWPRLPMLDSRIVIKSEARAASTR
jgi:hypothetical protein